MCFGGAGVHKPFFFAAFSFLGKTAVQAASFPLLVENADSLARTPRKTALHYQLSIGYSMNNFSQQFTYDVTKFSFYANGGYYSGA